MRRMPSRSMLSYIRRGEADGAPVVVVCNFTPVVRHGFRLGVPKSGRWIEKLNTDSASLWRFECRQSRRRRGAS